MALSRTHFCPIASTKLITPVMKTTPQPTTVDTEGHRANGKIENLQEDINMSALTHIIY